MDRFMLFKKDQEFGRKRTPVTSQSAWTCKICKTKSAKYTCPRCNLPYCSLDCYKSEKHGECTESFYKDCVMEDLKSQNVSSGTKKRMMETLKKMHNENIDEETVSEAAEEKTPDLADRLHGLDLDVDDEKVWNCLTEEERKEFERFLTSGSLADVIEPWQPWWMTEIFHAKVVEVDASDISTERTDIPTILPAPNLSAVFQRHPPSFAVSFSCINLLYSYVLVSRAYNGDHLGNVESAADDLLQLSVALQGPGGVVLSSPEEAVITATIAADGSSLKSLLESRELKANAMGDLISILKEGFFIQAALSDVITLLKKAWKKSPSSRKDLAGAFKKVEYFLGYVDEYPDILPGFIRKIQLQQAEFMQATVEQTVVENALDRGSLKTKPLIQEL